MSHVPPDLQAILDQIDAADRAADAIAARVTGDEFLWQPDGGRRWSIAECLDHLAATNVLYGAAMRGAIDQARQKGWMRTGPLASSFVGRRFLASMEPPVKTRLRAPGKVQPKPARSRDEILSAYHTAHGTIRQLVADSADLDLNRATFANPFFALIRVRVSTGLQVIPAHDRRHLWQAEQVELALRAR